MRSAGESDLWSHVNALRALARDLVGAADAEDFVQDMAVTQAPARATRGA